jgi:hypothetical protein
MKSLLFNEPANRENSKNSVCRRRARLEQIEIDAVRHQMHASTRFLNGRCDIAVARDDAGCSSGSYPELAAADLPRVFCMNAKSRWHSQSLSSAPRNFRRLMRKVTVYRSDVLILQDIGHYCGLSNGGFVWQDCEQLRKTFASELWWSTVARLGREDSDQRVALR